MRAYKASKAESKSAGTSGMIQGCDFQTGGPSKKKKWGDSIPLYPCPRLTACISVLYNRVQCQSLVGKRESFATKTQFLKPVLGNGWFYII